MYDRKDRRKVTDSVLNMTLTERNGSLATLEHEIGPGNIHYHYLNKYKKSGKSITSKVRRGLTTCYLKHGRAYVGWSLCNEAEGDVFEDAASKLIAIETADPALQYITFDLEHCNPSFDVLPINYPPETIRPILAFTIKRAVTHLLMPQYLKRLYSQYHKSKKARLANAS